MWRGIVGARRTRYYNANVETALWFLGVVVPQIDLLARFARRGRRKSSFVWHETLLVSFVTWLSRGCDRDGSSPSLPSSTRTDRIKLSFHGGEIAGGDSRLVATFRTIYIITDLTTVDFLIVGKQTKGGKERIIFIGNETHTTA